MTALQYLAGAPFRFDGTISNTSPVSFTPGEGGAVVEYVRIVNSDPSNARTFTVDIYDNVAAAVKVEIEPAYSVAANTTQVLNLDRLPLSDRESLRVTANSNCYFVVVYSRPVRLGAT